MLKFRNGIILLLFLANVSPALGQALDAAAWELKLQQVEDLLDAGEPARADSLWSAAFPAIRQLQDPVLEAKGLHLAGYIALERGDYQRAVTVFQQALSYMKAVADPTDPLLGQAHNDLGHYFFLVGQPDSAWQHHQIALTIRLNKYGPLHEKVADSYNNLANVLQSGGHPEAALPLYEKVLKIRRQSSRSEPSAIASALNNIGNAYSSLGNIDRATQVFQQALLIRRQTLGAQHPLFGRSLQNLGNVFYQSEQLDSARYYFQSALENALLNYDSVHPRLADLYENLGNCAMRENQATEAEQWYQKAMHIRESRAEIDPVAPATSYLYLGDVYRKKGDFLEAMRLTEQGWSILLQYLPETDLYLADAWEKVGLCHLSLGHFGEAQENFSKALEIRRSAYGDQHPMVAGTYNNLGNVLWQQSDFTAAIHYYQRALDIWEQSGENYNKERAESYSNIGNSYLKQEAYPEALSAYRKALQHIGTAAVQLRAVLWQQIGVVYDGLHHYQAAMDAYRKALTLFDQLEGGSNRREILLTRSARANTLLHIYQKGGNLDTLQLADAAFREGLDLLGRSQLHLLDTESRQKTMALHYDLFGGAIDCQLAQWEAKQDSMYLWHAFQLSEESKGLLLREKWLREKGKPAVAHSTAYSLAQVLHINEAAARVLQQKLQGNLGLLAFSYGPQQLFWFFLKDGRLQAGKIDQIREINGLIAALNQVITQFPTAGSQEKISLDSLYQSYALELHERIWKELEPHFAGTTALVIVPDGTLAYLPFAALLTEKPREAMRYRTYPYLLHNYQISYAYSAALLARAIEQEGAPKSFSCLAFAPTFEGHQPALSPLNYNTVEVNELSKSIGARAFLGHEATLANFLKNAPHYRVLHLATHGVANRSRSEFSYLAFSIPEPGVNGRLYLQDLYDMNLPVDLVVMSACESGLGLFQAGEGALSLGRGFVAAGARSIISTLWSVNDAKTADFMQLFYRKLQDGLPKDAAIREVQQQYIQQATQEDAHPFYWAAYLPMGDMTPLELGRNRLGLWVYGLLLVLLILGGWMLLGKIW